MYNVNPITLDCLQSTSILAVWSIRAVPNFQVPSLSFTYTAGRGPFAAPLCRQKSALLYMGAAL